MFVFGTIFIALASNISALSISDLLLPKVIVPIVLMGALPAITIGSIVQLVKYQQSSLLRILLLFTMTSINIGVFLKYDINFGPYIVLYSAREFLDSSLKFAVEAIPFIARVEFSTMPNKDAYVLGLNLIPLLLLILTRNWRAKAKFDTPSQ